MGRVLRFDRDAFFHANTLDENRDGSSLDDLRKQKECVQVTDDVTILKGILYSR
jgi:hypothetical protein